MIYEGVNVDVKGFNGFLPLVESSERRMERKIFPLNVNDGVGVDCGRGNMYNQGGILKQGGGYEDNSKGG